jgi:hypothetical protein
LKVKQQAYRKRLERKPTPHWTQRREVSGAVEDLERVEDIVARGLSEEDRRALDAIEALEKRDGRGSFGWDHASCKRMFYMGPIPGVWPDSGQLKRIRDYLEASKTSRRSAA